MIEVLRSLLATIPAPDMPQPESTSAGVITAIAAVVTALGGLVLSVTVLIPLLRASKRVEEQVGTVHTIVNQQRTDAQRYNIALSALLEKHGIEVPIDQSLPVIGHGDAGRRPVTPGAPPAAPVEVAIVNPDPIPVREQGQDE